MTFNASSQPEDIIINDTRFQIAPRDIQVNNQKKVSSRNFLRDNISYSFYSKFGRTNYTIVLAFDLLDKGDVKDLTNLYVQLDKFPFAFIKSNRLSDYIHGTMEDRSRDGYEIFAVNKYVISQNANANHVIFLTLDISYFNYLPFTPTFSFRDLIDNSLNNHPEPGVADPWYLEVDSLSQSYLYTRFFLREFSRRYSEVCPYGKTHGYDYFSLWFPVFIEGRDRLKKAISMRQEGGREMIEGRDWVKVYSGDPISEFNGEEHHNTEDDEIYVIWDYDLSDQGITDTSNISNSLITVQEFTVTKRNNFVYHNLTGWVHPVAQYMGRGTASINMTLASDSYSYDSVYRSGIPISPLFKLKHKLSKLDVNHADYKDHHAFNYLKLESLISSMVDLNGIVLNKELITSASDDQGKDILQLEFIETDADQIIGRHGFDNVGNKDPYFDTTEVADTLLQCVLACQGYRMAPPPIANATEVLEDLHRSLQEDFPLYLNPVGLLGDDEQYLEELEDFLRAINTNNYNHLDAKTRVILARELQKTLMTLIVMGEQGNLVVKPYTDKYLERIAQDYDSVINSFKDHGIPDLDLFNQDQRPFFMVADKKYLSFIQLSRIANIVGKKFGSEREREKINELFSKVIDLDNVNEIVTETPKLDRDVEVFAHQNNEDVSTGDISEEVRRVKLDTSFDEYEHNVSRYAIFNDVDVDPFDVRDQTYMQVSRMSEHFEKGLDLAFPVIKAYIVTGDETSRIDAFVGKFDRHNFYELHGVHNIELVCNNDESPVDVLRMEIANPESVYTKDSVAFNKYSPKVDPKLVGTSMEESIKIDQLHLKAGNRLHIKAGYSNNTNDLETIFNGEIVEVGGEYMLQVIAESFGRELIAYEYGEDPQEDNFFLGADTASIINTALWSDEIEHFGIFKFDFPLNGSDDPARRSLFSFSPTGLFKWVHKTELLSNIYYEEAIANSDEDDDDYGFSIAGLFDVFGGTQAFTHFPIYKSTPFSMLKEMEYRHPGMVSKPLWYGARESFFFGIKEQLYVYRDLPKKFMKHSFNSSSGTYDRLKWYRFKPSFDVHIALSETNIIQNSIKLSSSFNTVVNVQYYGDEDDIDDKDFDWLEMKLDENLRPSAHRRGTLEMPGTHGKRVAWHYGSKYLQTEAEKMYQGELIILGNEKVKAGDYVYINDTFRGLEGIVKVRECTHHFNLQHGYVTRIVPGLWTECSYVDRSQLFHKLHLMLAYIAPAISSNARSHNRSGGRFLLGEISTGSLLKYSNPDDGGLLETGTEGIYAFGAAYGITKGLQWIKNLLGKSKFISGAIKYGTKYGKLGLSKVTGLTQAGSAKIAEFLASKGLRITSLIPKTGSMGMGLARFTGSALLRVPPVAIVAGVAAIIGKPLWDSVTLGRQPVRMFPLIQNGKPFVSGIYGFEDNGLIESFQSELEEQFDSVNTILRWTTGDTFQGHASNAADNLETNITELWKYIFK